MISAARIASYAVALVVLVVCHQTQAVVITASSILPTQGGVHLVAPNTQFTVNVSVSGWDSITDGEVDGITLNFGFDPSLFTYDSPADDEDEIPTSGGFLDNNQQASPVWFRDANRDNVGGGVWGYELVDEADVAGNTGSDVASGTLASITFTSGSTLGTGLFTPSNASFFEPTDLGSFLFGDEISPSLVTYQGISVQIVPEPSSALLVAGLVGMGICSRRWRRARS